MLGVWLTVTCLEPGGVPEEERKELSLILGFFGPISRSLLKKMYNPTPYTHTHKTLGILLIGYFTKIHQQSEETQARVPTERKGTQGKREDFAAGRPIPGRGCPAHRSGGTECAKRKEQRQKG